MKRAYLLVNCYELNSGQLKKSLEKINEVKEVAKVRGPYDYIVRVESDTYDSLKNAITWKIRKHDKISSTMTLLTEPDMLVGI